MTSLSIVTFETVYRNILIYSTYLKLYKKFAGVPSGPTDFYKSGCEFTITIINRNIDMTWEFKRHRRKRLNKTRDL